MPGSGITPFNVGDLELRWWRIYRAAAKALIEAEKDRQARVKNSRGRK